MGLIINKSALLCSAFAVLAVLLGLNPYQAFIVSMLSFVPVRLLIGGKVFSQTGAFASFGAVFAMSYLNLNPVQAFVTGTLCGYSFLYFWILAVPKILKDKSSIKI